MHLLTDLYAWPFIRLDPLSSKRHFAFQANNASLLGLIFSHFLCSLSQLQSSNTLVSIPIPRLYNRLPEVNSLLASETHDTYTKEVEGQVIYHSWVGTVFGYHWCHSFLWRLLCISLLHPWDSQSEIVGLTEFLLHIQQWQEQAAARRWWWCACALVLGVNHLHTKQHPWTEYLSNATHKLWT